MRIKDVGLAAILMAGISTAAFAEVQNNYSSNISTTNVGPVVVNQPLTIGTTAVGNIISSSVAGGYSSKDNQATDNHLTTMTSATTNLNGVISTGGATVDTDALGNVQQISTGGTNALANGGAGGPLQSTGGQPIIASTNIGISAANTFAGLKATSAAVGNDISSSSTTGYAGLGDSTATYYGLGNQVNGSVETAGLNVANTDSTGAVIGQSQAIGNSIAVGVAGAGAVAANLNSIQANNAEQDATAQLTQSNFLTVGNSFGSEAVGNAASFGVATTGVATQANTVRQSAETSVADSTINGDFSAQAVGNVLSFAGDTGSVLVNQNSSGAQYASLTTSAPVILNAATSFSSLAVGNQFSGTAAPGQAPGTFLQQQDSGIGQTAITSVSGVNSAVGLTTVSASAVGNVATLTSPGAFMQGANAPTSATVNISGNFGGGLAVNTAAIGNSLSVK